MEVRLKVGLDSSSLKLAFVLTLSLTIAIAVPFKGAFAQTPGEGIPQKAPPGWDQQSWSNQRNSCIEIFKDIARYQSVPANKLPKLSQRQAQELYRQQDDCMRMAPHAVYTGPNAGRVPTLPSSPIPTPSP